MFTPIYLKYSVVKATLEVFGRSVSTPADLSDRPCCAGLCCDTLCIVHIRWKRQRLQSKREKLRDVINAVVRKVC